jgi:hypothetical protein
MEEGRVTNELVMAAHQLADNLDIVLRRLNHREELLYQGISWRLRRSPRSRESWIEITQLIYE